MERVAIVGSPGAGKSTLARTLAEIHDLDHIELDALFHRPGWEPTPVPEFRAAVTERLLGGRWVVDGNYRPVHDLIFRTADTIVFLDLPRWLVTARVTRRTMGRLLRREELWGTNRESLGRLFSRDPEKSIVVWTWQHHSAYRELYTGLMNDGAWDHAEVRHLTTRSAVRHLTG